MGDDFHSKYINLLETLGEEHPNTFRAWFEWAIRENILVEQSEFKRMLDFLRRTRGPEDFNTLIIWQFWIHFIDGYSSYAVVEEEYRKLYEVLVRVYGPTDSFTKDIEYRWRFALRKLNHSIRANEKIRKEREESKG